jgi:hypothetical protein
MYIDYYLKFESEQDYLNTLSSRISDETGQTEYFYPIEADVDAGITIFKELEEQVYDDESKTMVNRVHLFFYFLEDCNSCVYVSLNGVEVLGLSCLIADARR